MKLIEVLNAKPVLEGLLGQPMPGKLAYALVKNIRLLNPELEAIDKARDKMLAENWPFNAETNMYDIPDEDQERWHQMWRDFIDGESDIKPYLVDPKLFDNVVMTPVQLLAIDWLLLPEVEVPE